MNKKEPIIIKKKKIVVSGHAHSSAWKIAYADFVTAMMAFFLVMWLVNIVVEKKESVPSSFTPLVITDLSVGKESIDQESTTSFLVVEQKAKKVGGVSTLNKFGAEVNVVPIVIEPSVQEKHLQEEVKELKEDLHLDMDLKHTKVFAENVNGGLLIRFDPGANIAFFESGSAKINQKVHKELKQLAQILIKNNRDFIIIGHTDDRPFFNSNDSNWDLSFARANAVREFLVKNGVGKKLVKEIRGSSDRFPLDKKNPGAAENRRVTLFVLPEKEVGE